MVFENLMHYPKVTDAQEVEGNLRAEIERLEELVLRLAEATHPQTAASLYGALVDAGKRTLADVPGDLLSDVTQLVRER